MQTPQTRRLAALWRKNIAWPQEHGAWAFLLSPLAVGLAAGGGWPRGAGWLVLGALAAFFLRQPVTALVKVYAHRRPRRDLPAALFWAAVYALVGLIAVILLWREGAGYLLWLAAPGVPVFLWYLWLVAHRAERRRMDVEIVSSGVLALAAPAAVWLAAGRVTATGWALWLLLWFQAAASIVYAYARLEQRRWRTMPPLRQRLRTAWRPLAYTTFNLAVVFVLSQSHRLPTWLWVPYAVQWAETCWGIWRPAVRATPRAIGVRQFIVSTLFTVLFIWAWLTGG